MVECFHRQLKAALKVKPQPSAWIDALPLVLLSIRSALKEDIAATAAEMVYGKTLHLPGEFVNPTKSVDNLRACMQNLRPLQPRSTQQTNSIVKSLATATHIFVRHDAVRKPLELLYDRFYQVLKRTDKHFTIYMKGCSDTVSVDRLKPAHMDTDVEHFSSPTHAPAHSTWHHNSLR